ncbi:MAG: hypothetical protein ACREDK_07505 [Thermoplasmata archaeon]
MSLTELVAIGGAGVLVGWMAHWLFGRGWRTLASLPPHRTAPRLDPPEHHVDAPIGGSGAPSIETPRLSEGASTAGRVILHLYNLGRLGADEIGAVGFTQRGMSAALALRQGTLAKVLSRLKATGVLVVDRRHVAGESRRMNVYRLTSLGESVARDLRRNLPPPRRTIDAPVASGR